MTDVYIDAEATVADDARIGAGTKVWALAQVRQGASLGQHCIVGRGAFIDVDVRVGDACKIQNNALVYAPAVLEDGVFIGPAAILTNDLRPRAITPDGSLKSGQDWHSTGVTVRNGAAVGAGAVIVAGCTIGRWAMVAAGSTVTRDVPDHALVAGTPARPLGWVCRCGARLSQDGRAWSCSDDGDTYVEGETGLAPLR